MKYVIRKNKRGEWYWRIVARNGRILATSEAYSSKFQAVKTVKRVLYENSFIEEEAIEIES